MLQCDIKGCKEIASETLTPIEVIKHWIILRACQCGANDLRHPKSCTCRSEGLVPTSYWPNLDWYAFGGVDQLTLCPLHKLEVYGEILQQRGIDPGMNPGKQDRGNLH